MGRVDRIYTKHAVTGKVDKFDDVSVDTLGRRIPLPRPRDSWTDGEMDWADEAACTGVGVDEFFTEDSDTRSARAGEGKLKGRQKFCAGCAVRQDCLDYALKHNVRYGVWGGLTTAERAHLRSRA